MFTYILINCPVPHVSPNCSAYTVRFLSKHTSYRSFFIHVFSLHIQSSSCKKVLFHSPSPYISSYAVLFMQKVLFHGPSPYISLLHSPLHAQSPVPQSFSVYISPTQSSSCKKSCSTVLLRRSLPTLSHRDCVTLSTDLFTYLLHLFLCFFLYTKTM